MKKEEDLMKIAMDFFTFIKESNLIENETSDIALQDAVEAWNWAYLNKNEHIGIQFILHLHYLLMKRIRPDIAGKFRNCDIWIGGKRKIFVSELLLKEELEKNVCPKLNKKVRKNKEELCQETHVLFEGIHPFEDGNGRIGRILYNLQRVKLGLPIHIIHTGEEQFEYYKWFK